MSKIVGICVFIGVTMVLVGGVLLFVSRNIYLPIGLIIGGFLIGIVPKIIRREDEHEPVTRGEVVFKIFMIFLALIIILVAVSMIVDVLGD